MHAETPQPLRQEEGIVVGIAEDADPHALFWSQRLRND
jgi:hypothetical protein